MTEIEKYLEGIINITSGKQREYWQWVVKNGKFFTEEDRDTDSENKILVKPPFNIKRQACFYNSQILVLTYKMMDLQYFEGLFFWGGIPFPMEHCFAVIKDKVIDISARKWDIETTEWFGVHIPIKFVRDTILKSEYAGSILGRWYREVHENNGKEVI